MSLIIGSNAKDFAAFRAAIPAATGRRVFYPQPNIWPRKWPVVDASTAVLSIRPVPADLLAGKLDDSIRSLCESAPGDADLNAWHEAGNLAEYAPLGFVTAQTMTAVHQYMQKLVQGTPVSYGAVLCMPPTSMSPWMPGGLDWYGLDIYDWPQFHFPNGGALDISGRLTERLNSWLTVVRAQTGLRYPKLNICETNSAQPSSRAKWFTALGQWLNANGGHRMLTFWLPPGRDATVRAAP